MSQAWQGKHDAGVGTGDSLSATQTSFKASDVHWGLIKTRNKASVDIFSQRGLVKHHGETSNIYAVFGAGQCSAGVEARNCVLYGDT